MFNGKENTHISFKDKFGYNLELAIIFEGESMGAIDDYLWYFFFEF